MTDQELREKLASVAPEVPEHFHNRMEMTLENIVSQEAQMKESTKKEIRTAGRFSSRTIAIAAALAVMVCAVALAATQWNLFEHIPFLTGKGVPTNADVLMQSDLYHNTVNNVEITVREAGYDGRTLLVQYSYRMLDVDKTFGITAAEEFGSNLPEGMTPDTILDEISEEAIAALAEHHVGWNFDQLWINGVGVDMPNNSGGVYQGTKVPGELIYTEYWRIDNEGVFLKDGLNEITLPIGENLSAEEKKALWDADKKMWNMPAKGVATFTYDAKDVLAQVKTITPDQELVVPNLATAKVKEAAFSPLMTYITLDLKVDPNAMKEYIEANGEGYMDKDGNMLWKYGGMDVFGDWLATLQLVDGEGNLIFPGHDGQNGYGNEWAEYLYPYMETIPDELYLAPYDIGVADMTQAIPVKTAK